MIESNSDGPDSLLTENEAADLCRLSTRTFQARRGGGPPFVRLATAVRYRRRDLQVWLTENEQTGAGASPGNGHPAPPSLPALIIEELGRAPVHVAMWCPWCEDVHRHGAADGGGNHTPHCLADSHSPFLCTGYALDIQGSASSERAVIPAIPMAGERLRHSVMEQASGALSALFLRYALGLKPAPAAVVKKQSAGASIWVFAANAWTIEPVGSRNGEGMGFLKDRTATLEEGRGFISFAAGLSGVSPGIAAIRLLEAVTLDRLDSKAAFTVAPAIDEWVRRGAPARGKRS